MEDPAGSLVTREEAILRENHLQGSLRDLWLCHKPNGLACAESTYPAEVSCQGLPGCSGRKQWHIEVRIPVLTGECTADMGYS